MVVVSIEVFGIGDSGCNVSGDNGCGSGSVDDSASKVGSAHHGGENHGNDGCSGGRNGSGGDAADDMVMVVMLVVL